MTTLANMSPSQKAEFLAAVGYQEMNFTPFLAAGGSQAGFAYSTQKGRVTKINRLVHVEVNIILSAKPSGAAIITMGGFPFSSSPDYTGMGGVTILNNVGSTVNGIFSVNAGMTTANFLQYAGGVLSQLTAADIMNNTEIYFNGRYTAA